MRTTLDIDEDVLRAAQERARRERSSTGKVLSELARQTLTGSSAGRDVVSGFPTLPHRGGVVTSDQVYRLLDEDE